MSESPLLAGLNPAQYDAVLHDGGPLLVVAGAGSGKTRVLTHRIAHLIEQGLSPFEILAITFTNKAAGEMKHRVGGLVGPVAEKMWVSTFHSACVRILRRDVERLGFPGRFSIYDQADAVRLAGYVIRDLNLDPKRFPPRSVHGAISMAKNENIGPIQFADEAEQIFQRKIADVYVEYQKRLLTAGAMDFDDLLMRTAQLFREHPDVLDSWRRRFGHVLVDEYQDINALQGALCDRMAARCQSLTAVGDDAQSIYAFRGADFEQIAGFTQRHPDAKVLELTINYRSTPQILGLANRCIAQNRRQHPKQLRAVKQDGMVPAVIPLRDVYQQAELVAQRVLELHHEQGLPLRKMAVLYRNHSHSLELQVELSRRQIPFGVRSGVKFFEQAHIKDVVAYLRARENPRDGLSWVRLLRQWPGVGAQTAEKIAARLAGLVPEGEAPPEDPFIVPPPAEILESAAGKARGRGKEALGKLARLWATLEQENDLAGPGEALRKIVEAHYGEYADRTFSNAPTRREDLEHLATYADRYHDSRLFLDEVALVQGVTAENVVAGGEPDDMLILSTVHQAKGLEWPITFILWMADGRFPSSQALRSPPDLEEERRLFYVASTRAADELYLLYPTLEESRDGPMKLLRPSRFLVEVDASPPVFERWEIEEAPPDD